MYHTITDDCTTALLLTKPSSDNDSAVEARFRGRSIITTSPVLPSSISRHHQSFVRLLSLYRIDISTLMYLEPYLASFPCIVSCLMDKISQGNRG